MDTLQKLKADLHNKKLANYDCGKAMLTYLHPIFEMSELMQGLEASWQIDKNGVTAKFDISIPDEDIKIAPRLYVSPEDVGQVPLGCLMLGTLTESEENAVFFKLLNKRDVFFDIGANVGWYSILAGLYGESCYAFEPIPATCNQLKKNIELNNLRNVKTFELGLAEKNGQAEFYYHKQASGASSRRNLDYFSDGKAMITECAISTLDQVCKKERIQQLNLIKIDVEGGELFVLQGGIETLKRHRPFILCEMLRKWSKKFNYHPNDIIEFMKKLNYCCIALSRNSKNYVINEVTELTMETNYLFYPEEESPKIAFALK